MITDIDYALELWYRSDEWDSTWDEVISEYLNYNNLIGRCAGKVFISMPLDTMSLVNVTNNIKNITTWVSEMFNVEPVRITIDVDFYDINKLRSLI